MIEPSEELRQRYMEARHRLRIVKALKDTMIELGYDPTSDLRIVNGEVEINCREEHAEVFKCILEMPMDPELDA